MQSHLTLTLLLCLVLSVFCTFVQAIPSRTSPGSLDTNAKRFSRGLPPLPPLSKKKKRATRVEVAKRYAPSNVPGMSFTGNIKVTKVSDLSTAGYIARTLNPTGMYTVTTGNGNRLPVSFTAATGVASSQIDFLDTYNNRASTPYVGGVGTTITSGSGSFIQIAGVSQTPPGAPPQTGALTTSSGSIESAIWKYNPTSGAITVQWINPDGSTPTCYIVYDPNSSSAGGLVITADPTAYHNSHTFSYQVTFSLA